MKAWMVHLRRDLAGFGTAWGRFLFKRGYKWFSKFELVKDLAAKGMYRQRGRFSRSFVHLGMVGLAAMAATLAPVLAESFPGIDADVAAADQTPSSIVREVTDDATTTVKSDRVRDAVIEYVVQSGDTISSIATKFGVDTNTIKWENNLENVNTVKPGQTIKILPVPGVAHKVQRGETIYSIAKKYSAEPQAIADFPFNSFEDEEDFGLQVGQVLIVPGGEKPQPKATPAPVYLAKTPNAGSVSATGSFAWPITGIITQRWSWYHPAWDIASPSLPDIYAADAGVVVHAGWSTAGYGNMVMVDHQNGYITLYGHFSRLYVTVGQTVKRGDALGKEGSTGRSTGPHLHFEIRKGSSRLNPADFLR
jgi:murein DD-endopeptidase MepM/ murein hydrolase activator NlpD